MRTSLFALIGTLVLCLFQGTLSAQPQLPLLNIEEHIYYVSVSVRGGVDSREVAYANLEYSGLDSFRAFLDVSLRELPLTIPKGMEAAEYFLSFVATADLGDIQLSSQPFGAVASYNGSAKTFRLVKTETGFKLPPKAYEYTLKWAGGFSFVVGLGYTDYEAVMWSNGKTRTFSTKTEVNEFDRPCAIGTYRDVLRELGILSIIQEVVVPQTPWDRLQLTLWATDGTPTVLEYRRKPLRLLIAINEDGEREIQVAGDGAEDAELQQSSDLVHWVPASSLSSPPALSTTGARKHTITVVSGATEAPALYYRARANGGLQKL